MRSICLLVGVMALAAQVVAAPVRGEQTTPCDGSSFLMQIVRGEYEIHTAEECEAVKKGRFGTYFWWSFE